MTRAACWPYGTPASASMRHAERLSGVGEGPLLLSPFVLAELDYLLMRHVGAPAQAALLDEVVRGAYRLESFTADDVERAGEIMRRYGDLQIGLADASIVVLAERLGTTEILTLDLRHFQVLRVGGRKRFRIFPVET